MDKSITAHYDAVKKAIEEFSGKVGEDARRDAAALYDYHMDRVRDFQHERLVHLLVTFFFSGLLILSVIGMLWSGGLDLSVGHSLTYLFGGMGIILFVTVLLYVRHYYVLENGVQKLYTLTTQLRDQMYL